MKDHICSRCGSIMKQTGSEYGKVIYHCSCCGNNDEVEMKTGDNTEYWQKRSALLGRVRKGIIDWQTTSWEYLRNDILDFEQNYQAARNDIYFKIALIACLTSGFHNMNDTKYRECKRLFKVTEKVYKRYCKDPLAGEHFASETGSAGIMEYEEYRMMYKNCRNEYRNTKLAWKLAFAVAKKFIPVPKI